MGCKRQLPACMHRYVVPGWDDLPVLLLRGVPGGRNIVLRSAKDCERIGTRHILLPLRIGACKMPAKDPIPAGRGTVQQRDVTGVDPLDSDCYEHGLRML